MYRLYIMTAERNENTHIWFKTFSISSQLWFIYSISESLKRQTLPFSVFKGKSYQKLKQTAVMMLADTAGPLVTHTHTYLFLLQIKW